MMMESTSNYYDAYTNDLDNTNSQTPYYQYDSNSSLQTIHDELEENKSILKDNIEKITHRDQLILDIQEKSEDVSESATLFKKQSTKLKNSEWYRAYTCEIILVCIIVIIIIILSTVLFKK